MKITIGYLLLSLVFALSHDVLAADLHRIWESRCEECHGHAGDFARKYLGVEDGKLVGRHPVRDVRQFLEHHYPPGGEVGRVYAMLLAQVSNAPRFRESCGQCHGRAADFVRESLVLQDGVLTGRDSGQSAAKFLPGHRGLDPEDAAFFNSLFERVASETGVAQ